MKNTSLKVMRNLNGGKSEGGAASARLSANGQQLSLLMSLQELMGEAANQVTDPTQFAAWAESMGIDLLTPVIKDQVVTGEQHSDLEPQSALGTTPGYWASPGGDNGHVGTGDAQ